MRWAAFFWAALLSAASLGAAELPVDRIHLPAGFHIEVYTDHVPNARSMTFSPNGVLYVGTRAEGNVYAVLDTRHRNKADQVITLATGLQEPNGVAFKGGALYVAERSRILRFDAIETRLHHPPEPVVIRDDYPTRASHGWKFIAFGPDGRLYVPVGAPCNACKENDPIFASITRLSADGKTREVYAGGIRNTVGFDWQPKTNVLWFTDNGRDEMGDDVPPDEVNRAPKAGLNFGFPYCHGTDVSDPKFGAQKPCSDFSAPVVNLQAHVAALGMRFYDGTMFPAQYRGDIFIAEHGSWNRSTPIGYRIVRVRVHGDEAGPEEVFAEGWKLPDGRVWGRPVDVQVMPDGALLVSDDEAGAIYRISYTPPGH